MDRCDHATAIPPGAAEDRLPVPRQSGSGLGILGKEHHGDSGQRRGACGAIGLTRSIDTGALRPFVAWSTLSRKLFDFLFTSAMLCPLPAATTILSISPGDFEAAVATGLGVFLNVSDFRQPE
jgi:hypothetical protein